VEPIDPKSLAPGESITLTATIRVGETVGPLSHRALVETDLPGDSVLEFWTTANVIARARIEETTEKINPVFPGQSMRRTFIAYAYGTATEPPPRLDDSTLRVTSGATWEGAARDRQFDGLVIERSRPFSIELKAKGKPGSRLEDISLVDGKNVLYRQQLAWEVASALKASPPGVIVMQASGSLEKRVVIRSLDQTAFEILRVHSNLPGVYGWGGGGRCPSRPFPSNQDRAWS
jgi:hypothetical protein